MAAFLRPILERARRTARTSSTSASARTPDGARAGCTAASRPTSTRAGQVRGLYCTEYDIHELKTTEQALAAREEQLRLFTDNIPEPVVYLDAERRYAFVNEAFLDLTGLSRERVLGRRPAEVDGRPR